MFKFKNDNLLFLSFGALLLLLSLILVQSYLPQIIIIAIVMALIAIFYVKPEVGMYLTAIFLPVSEWLFSIGNFSAALIEFLFLLVLIAYSVKLLDPHKLKSVKWPAIGAFLLFFSASILSALFSKTISASLWFSVRWFLFLYLAYIFLPFNLINNSKILRRVIIFLSLSGLLVALMGLWSLIQQDWSSSIFYAKPLAIFGVYPIGDNHNSMAEILVLSSFLILSLKYWFTGLRVGRIIDILFLFFVLIALATLSRTAWIVIFLQVAFYFGYDFFVVKKRRLDLRYTLITIIFLLTISLPFVNRISNMEINQGSTASRLLMTEIAIKAFWAHPILGTGPGSYVSLVANNIRFTANYGDPLDSHGLGQKVLAELGGLGVITFAFFCLFIFVKFFRALRKYPRQVKLLLPLITSSLGIFLFQFFSTSYYKGRVWFPIALTLITIKLIEEKHEQHRLAKIAKN
ncbi:MAG: O-antigen ligase family protein [Candidatus Falkowbacteria bacterium]